MNKPAPELVMKPGGFKIEVKSNHSLAERCQKPCGIGKKQGAADAALVGVKGYGFHGT
jgi:hypothetical protein